MSDWLMQCYPLLEDLHRRMMRKLLDSGHIYTDDTTLPLQNDDPARRSTVEAKLWVYAKDHRHGPPLIVYEFSRSRTRECAADGPRRLSRLSAGRRLSGYDPLFMTGKIIEVACNVHARRKFVEAADLLEKPGRPHEALAFYCVASSTSGQKARRKMRDFELLQAPCRRSEVNEQTRVSAVYGGPEDRDFTRSGSAWRNGERGVPAARPVALGTVSLAGSGPGRISSGAKRDAQRAPRKDDAETRHKAEMERMRAVIAEITAENLELKKSV